MPASGVQLSPRVATALEQGDPIVALESTIITHGLPRPQNLEAAVEFERTVAQHGATPATIAVLDGTAHVGLEADELERIATATEPLKLSARDLPVAIAQRLTGGTTVAATAWLAAGAGIRLFATGGIGGVHRDAAATFDESADLGILARCPITVVCAGVKSILDIAATLERLETLSVVVLAYGTHSFPAFWVTDSGHSVDWSVSTPEAVAEVMRARDILGLPGAALLANPLPIDEQLDPRDHDRLLEEALQAAADASVRGKEITPFLLDHIHRGSRHTSLASNLAIVRGNCRLAAAIACAYADIGA